MRARRVAAALAVIALAACAAPSRRLTPRVVEDPIVLPRRMASASLGGLRACTSSRRHAGRRGAGRTSGTASPIGWSGSICCRTALRDPRRSPRGRARADAAVARGCARACCGIGYSSAEGMIVLPVVSVEALKHVADRWALSLSAGLAGAVGRARGLFTVMPAYGRHARYSGRRGSTFTLTGR